MAHHGDDVCGGGLCRCSTEFPYYSYRTKPTEQEFFVSAQTKIVVKVLIAIAQPGDLTILNHMDVGTIPGKGIIPPM
jgi:hypothetical protein